MITPEAFVDRCVAAAADMAFAFVGVSREDMLVALHQVRENLTVQLAEQFGPDVAAQMAEARRGVNSQRGEHGSTEVLCEQTTLRDHAACRGRTQHRDRHRFACDAPDLHQRR